MYATQLDPYSCGPIAIYNALVALGEPRKSIRLIRKDCDPHPDYGTLYTNFNQALRDHLPPNVECEYIKHPDYRQIRDHIQRGGVAIICEHWQDDHGDGEHYYIILGVQGNKFIIANRGDSQPLTLRGLRESLVKHRLDDFPLNCQHETAEDDLNYPTSWLLIRTT